MKLCGVTGKNVQLRISGLYPHSSAVLCTPEQTTSFLLITLFIKQG